MISDDANASPLQPDGLADSTESTTDRGEDLASTGSMRLTTEDEANDSTVKPGSESQILPQPSPKVCGVCGQAHWDLYAHLPIETDAYLAAVADLNRRSRSDQRKPSKPTTPTTPPDGRNLSKPSSTESHLPEDLPQNASGHQGAESLEGDDVIAITSSRNPQAIVPPEESDASLDLPQMAAEPGLDESGTPLNLADFPHGTAWRCCSCEALSLVWPPNSGPIAEVIEQPTRRRSSAEFRDSIKAQVECCLRAKATGSRSPLTLKRLRVLDLNLGRGSRADRNLALLHELGLAKHQIFGIGDDASTIDSLNFSGYQTYYGTIDRILDELPDNYFDLVLGFNIVEYLPNPSATIQRLTAKLHPGARIVLELSNPEIWQARLFRHGYWASYQRDRHILLGEKAIRVLGQRCNLAIEALKSYSEPQAWETSAAAWTRRKRHPLRSAMRNGWVRGTLVGLDRLRAVLGMASSRYGVVLVLNESHPPIDLDAIEIEDAI